MFVIFCLSKKMVEPKMAVRVGGSNDIIIDYQKLIEVYSTAELFVFVLFCFCTRIWRSFRYLGNTTDGVVRSQETRNSV